MVKKLSCLLQIEIGDLDGIDENECYCEHKVDEPDIVLDVPLLKWIVSNNNEAELCNGVTEATSGVDAPTDGSRENYENFKNIEATTDFHMDDDVVSNGCNDESEEDEEDAVRDDEVGVENMMNIVQ
ncbi:conserved hypothetical protein [Ricinus communis]|uniref:Uncharacterized protein n=1 Tax=Ricinus communis TaxID=3988 RepID=B9SR99_RICCO|nr:conserved hypothetical protein [Ricinus communis]